MLKHWSIKVIIWSNSALFFSNYLKLNFLPNSENQHNATLSVLSALGPSRSYWTRKVVFFGGNFLNFWREKFDFFSFHQIEHIDWHDHYVHLRSAAGIEFPGFQIFFRTCKNTFLDLYSQHFNFCTTY